MHGGVSDVRRFNNLIERILEMVQLPVGGFIAELDNATFIALASDLDLIQSFVEMDNALGDLLGEFTHTPPADEDEEDREEAQENRNLKAKAHKQLFRHRVKPDFHLFGVLEEGEVESLSLHNFVLKQFRP